MSKFSSTEGFFGTGNLILQGAKGNSQARRFRLFSNRKEFTKLSTFSGAVYSNHPKPYSVSMWNIV